MPDAVLRGQLDGQARRTFSACADPSPGSTPSALGHYAIARACWRPSRQAPTSQARRRSCAHAAACRRTPRSPAGHPANSAPASTPRRTAVEAYSTKAKSRCLPLDGPEWWNGRSSAAIGAILPKTLLRTKLARSASCAARTERTGRRLQRGWRPAHVQRVWRREHERRDDSRLRSRRWKVQA